jgi:hypothetical protein
MTIKIEQRYTINGRIQEFDCSRCGWPMYTGDKAVMTSDNEVFCGSGCANKHIKEDNERKFTMLDSEIPHNGCDLNHNEDRPVPPSSTCRHEVGRVAGVCIRCGAVYRLGRWVKVTP